LLTELGAKLKAKLEGYPEQTTYMDRLYHQCMQTVPMPAFMITSTETVKNKKTILLTI